MQDGSKENSTRKWTSEDKTMIVMESLTTNITVAELCRKYNLNPNVFYNCKQKFMKGSKTIVQDLIVQDLVMRRSTRIYRDRKRISKEDHR